MTDKELFVKLAAKDNRAFRYLYETQYDKIVALITRNKGKEEDAMDIFQDALMVLWTNVATGKYELSDRSRISTYLYGICRNLWMNTLRKNKTVSIEDINSLTVADGEDEMNEVINERIINLEYCIKKLGENCQKLLTLFYYEKTPMRVIAEKMNFTEKTVKNNKYRCMQKLKKLFVENNFLG